MCACGCPDTNPDHAITMTTFAVDMLRTLKGINDELGLDLHIRIGKQLFMIL